MWKQVVNFEQYREPLEQELGDADRSKGGRAPYGPVVMSKELILAIRTRWAMSGWRF